MQRINFSASRTVPGLLYFADLDIPRFHFIASVASTQSALICRVKLTLQTSNFPY